MLNAYAKAISYYFIGGFALALFCVPLFNNPADAQQPDWRDRARRRSWALALLGPLHPVLALASLGLAAEAEKPGEVIAPARDGKLRLACWSSIAASTLLATAVLLIARR